MADLAMRPAWPRPLGEETATLDVTGCAPREAVSAQAVEVLDGDIVVHASRLAANARAEVCVVAMPGMRWDIPARTTVRWRALMPRDTPAVLARAMADVRLVDDPPLGAFIVDRAVALMRAGRADRGDATLLVHQGGLLQALQGLFERTWVAAGPSHSAPDASSPPCAEDLQLLRLLLGGYTDEAIASRLDVGTRTVQRRVRDLIEAAGVRTRLQLIWHSTRRGWI
jgi:DNA-binding NarL/FixJ family response regulator